MSSSQGPAVGADAPAAGTEESGAPQKPRRHNRSRRPAIPATRKDWYAALPARYQFFLVVGVTVVAAGLFVEFLTTVFSGDTSSGFLVGGLAFVAIGWVWVFQNLVIPLNALERKMAHGTNLADAIEKARYDFIRSIREAVIKDSSARQTEGSPPLLADTLSEETVDEIDVLISAVGVADGLLDTMPGARKLLGYYTWVLTIALPVLLGLGFAVREGPQNLAGGFLAFFVTLIVGLVLLFYVSLAVEELISQWAPRVKLIQGLPFERLKRSIRDLVEKE